MVIEFKFLKPNILLLMMALIIFSYVQGIDNCSNDGPQVNLEFYLVKKCHRSNISISARSNAGELSSCKRFALEKKAFSFNFSPQVSRAGRSEYTCEVLTCPEISTDLSPTNDSGYDYYSLFANTSLIVNATCVPSLGMFHFVSKKVNYSESINVCRNMSGVLADVTSEDRTNALAKLLADVDCEEAFINLKRNNGSNFITANGHFIECTSYRAWALGHPKIRGNADCVTVTRHRTWRSVSCEERLPALCEHISGKKYLQAYLRFM